MGTGRKAALTTLMFALLGACGPFLPPPPPPPDPVVGAGCVEVCDRFRELECDEALPAADGSTCEQLCEESARWYDTPCLAGIETCEQQDACAVE